MTVRAYSAGRLAAHSYACAPTLSRYHRHVGQHAPRAVVDGLDDLEDWCTRSLREIGKAISTSI